MSFTKRKLCGRAIGTQYECTVCHKYLIVETGHCLPRWCPTCNPLEFLADGIALMYNEVPSATKGGIIKSTESSKIRPKHRTTH